MAASDVRPTRRTLVRTAAWSVPVVSLAAAAPAFAASPCATTSSYRVTWAYGMANFTRSAYDAAAKTRKATVPAARQTGTGATSLTVTFDSKVFGATIPSGSDNPDGDFNLTIPRNTTAGTPTNTTVNPVVTDLGALGNKASGLMLYHDQSPAGRDNRQEVTISFGQVVSNLSFWMTDIDCLTTNTSYADRVELDPPLPTSTVNQLPDPNIRGDGTVAAPWKRADINGNNLSENVGENNAGARVKVTYTQDVSSVKLTYWNNLGGAQFHRIFISDLTFDAKPC